VALPFLTYLTVFKARLGLANIVLNSTGFGHQSSQTVGRKLRQLLDERRDLEVGDPENSWVLQYLADKKLIGADTRSRGRYASYTLQPRGATWIATNKRGDELSTLPVYLTDTWMADPRIPSTIGVPTPDNTDEVLEVAIQLKLISKATNTWTASGQLVDSLRRMIGDEHETANPFLLRFEAPALLRQVLEMDGVLLRELLAFLVGAGGKVTRPQVAEAFGGIVERAVVHTKELRVAPMEMREALAFQSLIREQTQKLEKAKTKATGQSRAPGVLEHRVSPRLEWLTDLGYLSKDGLTKNSFEYRSGPSLEGLSEAIDRDLGTDYWADEVAVEQWRSNPYWSDLRRRMLGLPLPEAIRAAYRMMQRRIGPAPLREVAFITALMSSSDESVRGCVDELITFAQETDGVTLSRGRYRRTPENIFMSPAVLAGQRDAD
jgi:hypothetical protein